MARPDADMLHGTLDVVLLKTLTWGPMHGYGIIRWLQQLTDDVLDIEDGSLYPALHRMESKGWIDSEWGLSDNNRRAKYYRLTPTGRKQLRAHSAAWSAFSHAVSKVLAANAAPVGVAR
jgi:PadR family transcriptional regulator PadR